jgi:heptosyltransferase-2
MKAAKRENTALMKTKIVRIIDILSDMSKSKRILVVRPDRIGDVVLSTPVVREIKRQYPDAFVAVLVSKYTQDIYLQNPYVDKILFTDDYDNGSFSAFVRKVKEIRSFKFTHSFSLLPQSGINYLLFWAGIPYRMSEGIRLYQFLTFTRFVSRHKYIPLRHEADYCLDQVRRIGVEPESMDTEIFLSSSESAEVQKRKSGMLGEKKFIIGVHTSSKKSAPNWTPATYKLLIDKLNAMPEVQIVITDVDIPEELRELPGVQYRSNKDSLRDSILSFAACDLLVSSSTGPMHIAAALKVPTVSLFCPLPACSPVRWGPLGNRATILLPAHTNCDAVCKTGPYECTFSGESEISVDKAFRAMLEALNLH